MENFLFIMNVENVILSLHVIYYEYQGGLRLYYIQELHSMFCFLGNGKKNFVFVNFRIIKKISVYLLCQQRYFPNTEEFTRKKIVKQNNIAQK